MPHLSSLHFYQINNWVNYKSPGLIQQSGPAGDILIQIHGWSAQRSAVTHHAGMHAHGSCDLVLGVGAGGALRRCGHGSECVPLRKLYSI